MKKSNNKTYKNPDHSSLTITTSLYEPRLLKNLVEKLADHRCDIGYSREKAQPGWQIADTSSIEAYVSGDINLSNQTDFLNLPFITCFLFTCIKGKGKEYNLSWSISLS